VRKVQTANGVALTLQYAYTKSGQLQAMTYPDGTVADYVRNTQGQVTGVGVTRPGQAREVLLHQATYHPFGPIAGWVYGNGRTMQRNVDLDYRPTSIQGGAGGLDLTYGYDEVGNLTSLASGSPPPMEYGYDALGRLTETRDAPTQAIIDQYAYDKTGNRTSYTDSLGTKAYAYPATSHRLSSVAGENRTYDAVGNTLSIGTARAFDYNDAGRMSQVRNGGVVAMEYAYNGRGEQVRKHLGTTETQALYDEAGHWLGDYGTSGVVSQQAIWMDDMPVGVLDGGQLYYIQPDHLGTPRTVIDPARNVAVWRWDAKGEVFGNTSPEQDADGDGILLIFNARLPGQRYDVNADLSYNYFRDYEASTARYVQSDPIGLLGGVATYSYVKASPLLHTDTLGLQARALTRPWWWWVTPWRYPVPVYSNPEDGIFADTPGNVIQFPTRKKTEEQCPDEEDNCFSERVALMTLHFRIDAKVGLDGYIDNQTLGEMRAWNIAAQAWNEKCTKSGRYPRIDDGFFYPMGPGIR
jgi:RHS repeat-associated protein